MLSLPMQVDVSYMGSSPGLGGSSGCKIMYTYENNYFKINYMYIYNKKSGPFTFHRNELLMDYKYEFR